MTPEIKDITKILKIEMIKQDLTEKDLAAKTGFSKDKVKKMLNNEIDYTLADISILETALDCILMIVPDKQRIITIKIDIDTHRKMGLTEYNVTENGKPKENWTVAELLSTAEILSMTANKLLNEAKKMIIENEKP